LSIKTPEPQIQQKNPRSSEKKQQWQHCYAAYLLAFFKQFEETFYIFVCGE